jgi:hypothetical protein
MDEGISFLVRIRDEEDLLEQSIRSLFDIQIPHEILLILHLCTDRSAEIAEKLASENSNVRILEYTTPISRPGYETLCTDKDSPHSLMTYYTWCYQQARYPWLFKWDADFLSTPELIEYINNCRWCRNTERSHEIFIHADSPDGHRNTERYIVSGEFTFQKYWFWEYIEMKPDITKLYVDISVVHQSPLEKKKKYWDQPPWFLDYNYLNKNPEHYIEASQVLSRYAKLIEVCGQEINAQARASNPDSTSTFHKVLNNKEKVREIGIRDAL